MENDKYDVLLKLPKKNLLKVMIDALDIMQGFNGYSKSWCIGEAMGLERYTDENGNSLHKMIPFKEVRRKTNRGF